MLRSGFFVVVICENDMLWSGNLGLKWGSLAWHIPNMHIFGSAPPPPRIPPFLIMPVFQFLNVPLWVR